MKLLNKVSNTLEYSNITSIADLKRKGAVSALETKNGVCMEYSDLMLSALRAQGIPARAVYGDGIGNRVDRTLEGIGHQWVGVWFKDVGWIPVDPTWSNDGYEYFGHDFDHLTWYVASKSANEPSGFDCMSWDSNSPCKDALKITTESVNEFPNKESLMDISQLREKVKNQTEQLPPVQKALQNTVDYLGSSQFGRVILSKQGLLVLFALTMYLILVFIVSSISKLFRNRNKKRAEETINNT